MPSPSWQSPPLSIDAIQIIAFDIDNPRIRAEQQLDVLTRDERERAARFRFDEPRNRFVAARYGLRKILADHLRLAPENVRFAYDTFGKPALDPAIHDSTLSFNLAHSAGMAIVGICDNGEIGVDVERVRPVRHLAGIAKRFFHQEEAREVLAAANDQQQTTFFRCWTHKEAIVKAVGTGLQFPLGEFRVPVTACDATWIELPKQSKGQTEGFWLQSLNLCDGYLAAIATSAKRNVELFHVAENPT